MDDKHTAANETVSYMVFESELARQERNGKKLWILVIVLIVLLVGTNGAWLYHESLYEDAVTTTQTITQDTGSEGGTNTFNGDFYGGDYNGKTDDNKNSNENP